MQSKQSLREAEVFGAIVRAMCERRFELGCPILDDFQGWGFGLYFRLSLGFQPIEWAASMQSLPVKIPTLQKLKDGAPKTSKPSETSGRPPIPFVRVLSGVG